MGEIIYGMDLDELLRALAQRNRELWRAIEKRDNYEWFRNLWEAGSDNQYRFYDLYRKVREEIGLESDPKEFDRIWSCHCVVAESFESSLDEWAAVLVND